MTYLRFFVAFLMCSPMYSFGQDSSVQRVGYDDGMSAPPISNMFQESSSVLDKNFQLFQKKHTKNLFDGKNYEDKIFISDAYNNSNLIIPRKYSKKRKPFSATIQAMSAVTSNKTVPFWMRANQYGSIPLDGASFSLIGNLIRSYDTSGRKKLIDWGMGLEGRINAGNKVQGILVEGYLKARISVIELKAGRWKEIMGLVDPDLSTGAFAISGNALGIPKAQIGIADYWNFPFTKGILAFKGNIAFGSFGETPLRSTIFKVKSVNSYYHQKSLYGRIGKQNWKIKLYGGINHQVIWGHEKDIYGANVFKLSSTETLRYILMGKAFGTRQVESSKIGNHIGSVDQGLEVNLKNVDLMGYHQFYFDVGALYHLANLKDGTWGLSIKNKENTQNRIWNKIVIEFIASKSQAGEADAKWTPSGDEDYYNNYIYAQGWGYEGENLGNPLFTARKYARKDLSNRPYESHVNNRILAFHTAIEGRVHEEWGYTCKLTYSQNFGTYGTSPVGNSTGGYYARYPPPYFKQVNQFSGYIEVNRPILNGYNLGVVLAVDQGRMLYNSVGGMIKLSKSW